jgi:tRNA A-37 threonylcarbamoyl transferase component Bud32
MLQTHTQALKPGARLSQYEITGVLGSGGFGITYLAHDTGLDAPVAIKEYLPSELAVRQDATRVTAVSTTVEMDFKWGLDRFLDEARVLAKFRHPNIVHIFQVFESNNTAYIVMEYAKGETLSERIQRCGVLDERRTRDIVLPLMDGLKRVHERGFLHRDIKPGNIILRDEGGPALIDFGAARQAIETKSRSITSIVTEGYAPLEQYDPNGNQGPWTDIYALGAVAYKCLSGKTPPAATSRIRNDSMPPLRAIVNGGVSEGFEAAIGWALSVYEEDRPQNIDNLLEAMQGNGRNRPHVAADATRVLRSPATRMVDAEATQHFASASAAVGRTDDPPAGSFLSGRTVIVGAGVVTALIAIFVGLRVFSASNPSAETSRPVTAAVAPQAIRYPKDIAGDATVRDTGRLVVAGHHVRLAGVDGFSGTYAATLQGFIASYGGAVNCEVVANTTRYRCWTMEGHIDISEAALLNGAARAGEGATAKQLKAEAGAKTASRGIWKQS